MRAAHRLPVLVAVLFLSACGGGEPAAPSRESVPPTTVPAGPPPTTTAASLGTKTLKTVTVTEPNPYGNFEWSDNSPDYQPGNAGNAVKFKYWDCQKTDVFNNVVFRIEVGTGGSNGYLDGHDEMDRNPVEATTPTGEGLIHIWGTGPEGTNHYPVEVLSEGHCKFQLDFVTQGEGGGADARTPVWRQDGHGNDNLDTPALKTPWQLAWGYRCPSAGSFAVADDKLGGRHIVDEHGSDDSGVFEQGGSAGARTLTVVTGDDCTWTLAIYE
ncbi:hypothetical protein ACQP00_17350 [Dactylosporangium sp. CS-047395]|uniref:hypothetical protein n=1 Tax=Dactylosporangium sp. CS-047395 TaxID=3239936 RepID=UPI003D8E2EDE